VPLIGIVGIGDYVVSLVVQIAVESIVDG